MPKGAASERVVVCRACCEPFLTAKTGKGSYYCRRPACDAERARTGFVVRNEKPMSRLASPSVSIARSVMTLQAARERERARFERQWRREVEAWLQRRPHELAAAEARRARLEDRLARARDRADQAIADLRALEQELGITPPAPTTAAIEVLIDRQWHREEEPRGDVSDLFAVLRRMVLGRRADPPAGRKAIQRAIVRLAHASGLPETHQALRHLATEVIAWELALPTRVRNIDIDTQAMRDAA